MCTPTIVSPDDHGPNLIIVRHKLFMSFVTPSFADGASADGQGPTPVDTIQNVKNTDTMSCKIKAMMRKIIPAQVAAMVVHFVRSHKNRRVAAMAKALSSKKVCRAAKEAMRAKESARMPL
jgi:hypothetical protein